MFRIVKGEGKSVLSELSEDKDCDAQNKHAGIGRKLTESLSEMFNLILACAGKILNFTHIQIPPSVNIRRKFLYQKYIHNGMTQNKTIYHKTTYIIADGSFFFFAFNRVINILSSRTHNFIVLRHM